MTAIRIDSHLHFWKYSPEEYGWIGPDQTRIRRDFLPEDLQKEIGQVGIDGVVAVQARTTLEEVYWLATLAGKYPFIRGVVGWVPLCDQRLEGYLAGLEGKLCGVREVCQGQAEGFMLRSAFVSGVRLLADFELSYDILIFESQLKEAIRMVDLCPGQTFVLDHVAKPRIKAGEKSAWAKQLFELSRRENVYCKISGMVTEANSHGWTEEQLRPYFETALIAFGPRRLMFGSDWPVCLVASEYVSWFNVVDSLMAKLSAAEREEILGGTAVRAYRLS